jgi:phosphate starvation-inducible PhoH-like protein
MSEDLQNKPTCSDEYCFKDQEVMLKVLGPSCENLAILQKELKVTMGQRGLSVYIKGDASRVMSGLKLIDQLARASRNGRAFTEVDLVRGSRILTDDPDAELDAIFNQVVYVTARRRLITPKGLNQKKYVEALLTSDLIFSIGPAGTGKTYLAVAVAVAELMQKRYRRIVLTRPAVEAGERLGFLPGDLAEKINPYLRPLYDALDDMLGSEKTAAFIGQGRIEIAPLAFMRGRTLNDSFVILDEAQNTTREQMKMFLTRLGYSSKAVVTGDISQIDLPGGAVSGLVDAQYVLRDIEGISFAYFSDVDVVRHPLVQDIIKAYENRKGNARRHGEKEDDESN